MSLPYAAEIDLDISIEELDYLESRYNNELNQGDASCDTQFLYSWGLIRSPYGEDKKLGITLLKDIISKYPDRKRDCLYYLALAYCRTGEYRTAREYTNELLKIEPDNLQAKSLLDRINGQVAKDGILGMALVGGAIAAGIGVLMATLHSRHRGS